VSRKDFSLRFAGGTAEGRRSGAWRIWAQNGSSGKATNSDVYLAARSVAHEVKVSLHESGSWQYSITSAHAAKASPSNPGQARHLQRWLRPAEFAPGLTLAFRFYLPESEFRAFRDDELATANPTWLPIPPPGSMTEVSLILGASSAVSGDWPGRTVADTQLLGQVTLVNSETLWIVHRLAETPALISAAVSDAKLRKGDARRFGYVPHAHPALRMWLFGRHEDGCAFLIDVAPDGGSLGAPSA
jgi:hypothetical protein